MRSYSASLPRLTYQKVFKVSALPRSLGVETLKAYGGGADEEVKVSPCFEQIV
jgi:hypothetical protein